MAHFRDCKRGARVRIQDPGATNAFKGAAIVINPGSEVTIVVRESEGNWRRSHNLVPVPTIHLQVVPDQFSVRGEKLRAIFGLPSTPKSEPKET